MLKRHEFTLIHLLHRVCQNPSPRDRENFNYLSPDMYVIPEHKYIIVGSAASVVMSAPMIPTPF